MDRFRRIRAARLKPSTVSYALLPLLLGAALVAFGLGMRTDSPASAPAATPEATTAEGEIAAETPTVTFEHPTPEPTREPVALPTVDPPTPTPEPTPSPIPTLEPTQQPTPAPSTAEAPSEPSVSDGDGNEPAWQSSPYTRLMIPAIGVNAPIDMKGLDPGGVMQDPDAPDRVVWYDFSAGPGENGNAVIAGHLDHASVGPAVFWHLGDLRAGDVVEIRDVNDVTWLYLITSVASVDANADAGEVLASGDEPTLTLITCDGTFNYNERNYDERLIVRAVLIAE